MNRSAVDLDVAFAWTCANCGHRNFLDGVPLETTDDDPLRTFVDAGGEFVYKPASVKCEECVTRYRVKPDEPIDFPESAAC